MTSTRRWKLLCGVLTALTVYSWTRSSGVERAHAAASTRQHVIGYRPLRVSAAALGTSTDEIVERLLASHSQSEMRKLCEQLGAVGDDAAIDAVMRLVSDPRPGVPAMVISAIGTIGTDHAVEILVDLADDPRSDIKWTAIYSLGSTGNERAETFLISLAKRNDTTAIEALGDLATDHAIDVLYKIASTGSDDAARSAISTLGGVDTPAAIAALAQLIDSPSVEIASKALAAIQNVDAAMLAKLTTIVKAGEVQLARPAALAIAHVGDDAIELLGSLALEATSSEVRIAAVQALGTIHSSAVVETLGTLIESDEDELAREAARALAQIETPEARDLLINAALGDRAEATQAIEALVTMQGPEIDQALLEIAKSNQYGAERALARLLSHEDEEALGLVVARAGTGTVDERLSALTMLADAGTDASSSRLLAIARSEHGELKTRALELVTRSRPGDPQVTEMLRDSLHAGDADEQRAAAIALGRVGTDAARDALVSALTSSDSDLGYAALSALSSYRLDESACNAIYSAALSNPELLPEAMRKLLSAGSPQGLRLAETALSGDSALAQRTLQFLAEANPPGAADLIVRSTRSGDEYVRAAALNALASTRAPNAVDVIAAATRDSSYRVRTTAASALSGLGGDRARDALIQMTRSAQPSDRLTALQYLPDDPTSLSRTRELLRDSDSSVVYTAMRCLAANSDGAVYLRQVVMDTSRSDDSRSTAANMLENYGHLDEVTAAWLRAWRARYDETTDYYD
jgi:HEAT repeat protein